MGLRFHRRLTVVPGVTLNLGKRGASISLGRRGAHATFGRDGVRETVGLPGSGLSYTTRQRWREAGGSPLALLFVAALVAWLILSWFGLV